MLLHTTPEAIDAHLNILDFLDVEGAHFVETSCTTCYNSRISSSYTSQLVDRRYATATCKLKNELLEIGLMDRCTTCIVERRADLARFQQSQTVLHGLVSFVLR